MLDATPAILARHADLPVHDRADLRPGRPGRRRLARGQRVLQDDAGVHRADPPPGQVHGPRGAGRGRPCRRTSRPGSGPAGRSRSRTRSASSSWVSGCASRASIRRRARDAAAGWGGDRLAVVEGPDGAWAVAMQTAWDTEADAAAFETAATTALKKATGVAQVLPGRRRQDALGAHRQRRRDGRQGRRGARARRLSAPPTSSRARRSPAARARSPA